ncbi:MAG: hypothetical protein M3203_13710 [Actinomycetota bacterium]|nr:hypothetical protein [Actinomycetota bacterium]
MSSPAQGVLSRSGSDVGRYAAVAMALVVAGALLTISARRRRAFSRTR